jgi:hypothetical protein
VSFSTEYAFWLTTVVSSANAMQTRVSHYLRDLERAGLIGAGTTLHGLRISYAAWWKRTGGANNSEMADLLGDKSERMGKHYTGAGGGTRTHTTLPSRDFKSLASTSSATSAPLFLIGFSPRDNECFPGRRSRFPKRCKTCSLCVPHPCEGPDDVRLLLDMPGVGLSYCRFHLTFELNRLTCPIAE